MENLPSEEKAQPTPPENIIFIEFYSKKNFPVGVWNKEPDFCQWQAYGSHCIVIRDMKLGSLRGFVACIETHKAYKKSFDELSQFEWYRNLEVHGMATFVGKLPPKYNWLNKDNWWIGFECNHGEDYLPLTKLDRTDPMFAGINSQQTYKDFHFVRKQVSSLAKQLLKANKK